LPAKFKKLISLHRPIDKLTYATGADPAKRFEKLSRFCKQNGLDEEREFFEKSLAALR